MNKISLRNRNKGTGRRPNWEYRFEAPKIDGKRKQISHAGYATKKDAYNAGVEHLNKYKQNKIINTPVSFHDYFLSWLNVHTTALSYSTKRVYRQYANNYILPFLGAIKLTDINTQAISELLLDCQKKRLSGKSLISIRSLLNMALDDAVSIHHYLPYNPCSSLKTPRSLATTRHRSPITQEQWSTITKLFPEGSGFHVLLCLGYYAGLRISEATALTWDDIDFSTRSIRVNKQILYQKRNGKYNWVFDAPKTQSSVRRVLMPAPLFDVLLKEKERQIQQEVELGASYIISINDGDAIVKAHKPAENRVFFVTLMANGRHINSTNFKHASNIIKQAIPDFDFHTLRHTHATMLMESGASIKAVQTRLGHSSVNMALQVYSHNTETLERSAVDNYSAFLENGGQNVDK